MLIPKYEILTETSILDNKCDDLNLIKDNQISILFSLIPDCTSYTIHYFDSLNFKEHTLITNTIRAALDLLNTNENYDLVKFNTGSVGFVIYQDNCISSFEILYENKNIRDK